MINKKSLILDDTVNKVFRVNRHSFVDSQIFQKEKNTIFSSCWLYIGHGSELVDINDFILRNIAGRSLIFLKDSNANIRVFLNSCRHRGAEICRKKRGNSQHFICPYHGWSYSNKGQLVGIPSKDAYPEDFISDDLNLIEIQNLSHYKNFYFINFSSSPNPLQDYLGAAKYYLDLIYDQCDGNWEVVKGAYKHDIKINWKILVDNSTDLYHLPFAHKRYLNFLQSSGVSAQTFKRKGFVKNLNNGHAVVSSTPPSGGRPIAYWTPVFSEQFREKMSIKRNELVNRFGPSKGQEMCDTNRGLFIFPNLIINDNMAVTIRSFQPTAIDNIQINQWMLAPKNEDSIERKLRLDSLLTFVGPGSFGTPDDVEILESCQRSYFSNASVWNDLSRGMDNKIPLHTDEYQNRIFWREWKKYVFDERAL